jgi:hypothetical protein
MYGRGVGVVAHQLLGLLVRRGGVRGPVRRFPGGRRNLQDDPHTEQGVVLGDPHRPSGRLHSLGRLLRRHPEGQPQHQHLPLVRGQVCQQRPHVCGALGGQHLVFGAVRRDRGVWQLGTGSVRLRPIARNASATLFAAMP